MGSQRVGHDWATNVSLQARIMNRRLVLKRPQLPSGFQGRIFKGSIWGEGCSSRTLFWLVGGEVIRNQHHQSSGSKWSGVCILVGSVLLLTVYFSHLVWVSVFAKHLGDIIACITWWRTKTLSQDCTICSLDCLFFLWLESPSFPNLTTAWGKVMEAEEAYCL